MLSVFSDFVISDYLDNNSCAIDCNLRGSRFLCVLGQFYYRFGSASLCKTDGQILRQYNQGENSEVGCRIF